MNASESWPERSRWEGFDAMAGLFFPRSWSIRLILLAGILEAVGFEVPDPFGLVFILLVVLALGVGAFLPFISELSEPGENLAFFVGLGWWLVGGAFTYAVWVVTAFLVSLASNGDKFATAYYDPFAGAVGWAELLLVIVALWLLIGVPNQAYKLKLGKDGRAQHVVVGVITATACVLTGTYLLLQHFGRGQLSSVKRGPLAAGIVFTAVLVWPFYRSLARACWQRGTRGVLNPKALKDPWRETVTEVWSAKRRAAEAIRQADANAEVAVADADSRMMAAEQRAQEAIERAQAEAEGRVGAAEADRDQAREQAERYRQDAQQADQRAAAADARAEDARAETARAREDAARELEQLRADTTRERDELRAALESRAQVLEESHNELRARTERAERDLDAARAELAGARRAAEPAQTPAGSRRRRGGQTAE